MDFLSCIEQGYFIRVLNDPAPRVAHRFCGEQHISGAWCQNCEKPLLKYLTIDHRDPVVHALCRAAPLHLLYCWTCTVPEDYFQYRAGDDSVEILRYVEGACYRSPRYEEFPYRRYPRYFPEQVVELVPLSSDEQSFIKKCNREYIGYWWGNKPHHLDYLYGPMHQLGGEPWMANPLYDNFYGWAVKCAACGNDMPFLASFDNDATDGMVFTENSTVQMLYFYCKNCAVVAAIPQID